MFKHIQVLHLPIFAMITSFSASQTVCVCIRFVPYFPFVFAFLLLYCCFILSVKFLALISFLRRHSFTSFPSLIFSSTSPAHFTISIHDSTPHPLPLLLTTTKLTFLFPVCTSPFAPLRPLPSSLFLHPIPSVPHPHPLHFNRPLLLARTNQFVH